MTEHEAFRDGHAVRLRASVAAALAACWIGLLLTGSSAPTRPSAPTPRTVVEFVDLPEDFALPTPPADIRRPSRDLAVVDPEPVVSEAEPQPEPDEPSRTDPEPSNAVAATRSAPFVVFDEAPRVRRMTMPEYPAVARTAGIEGWVVCAIHLDAGGRVTDVRVLDSSSDLFHEAARTAIFASSFSPARQSGQAVACVVTQKIVFELR